jgi:hypothetical protein
MNTEGASETQGKISWKIYLDSVKINRSKTNIKKILSAKPEECQVDSCIYKGVANRANAGNIHVATVSNTFYCCGTILH